MKKLFALLVVAGIGAAFAATSTEVANKPLPDKSKLLAKREKMLAEKRAQIEADGGLVQSRAQGSVIGVFNTQKTLPPDAVARCADAVPQKLRYPVEFLDAGEVTMELLANPKFGAIVLVGEYAGNQMLIVNPDRPMVMIDVRALSGDGAGAQTLEARVQKTLLRGVSFALGAAITSLGRIGSLKTLDEKGELRYSPDVYNSVSEGASQLRIKPVRFVTYKQSCIEGWASAPTNDVQKAIWDKVHAMPSEPIKIKPEEKKTER